MDSDEDEAPLLRGGRRLAVAASDSVEEEDDGLQEAPAAPAFKLSRLRRAEAADTEGGRPEESAPLEEEGEPEAEGEEEAEGDDDEEARMERMLALGLFDEGEDDEEVEGDREAHAGGAGACRRRRARRVVRVLSRPSRAVARAPLDAAGRARLKAVRSRRARPPTASPPPRS